MCRTLMTSLHVILTTKSISGSGNGIQSPVYCRADVDQSCTHELTTLHGLCCVCLSRGPLSWSHHLGPGLPDGVPQELDCQATAASDAAQL